MPARIWPVARRRTRGQAKAPSRTKSDWLLYGYFLSLLLQKHQSASERMLGPASSGCGVLECLKTLVKISVLEGVGGGGR